ncbi:MAG: hypothetical protein HC769_02130 [Cyanobacteria bacterium CRU_2_1]|nr:hypothetical protein [Cyanobacteria bacterium RU_5_0]NJR57753.1 hypothetical protein [Cyanobacteria bacterium CRU_2_1]
MVTEQEIAERFVDSLLGQGYQDAWQLLHPTLQAEILPQQLQQQVEQFQRLMGAFVRRLNT